jgi:hypothetical protein
VLRVQQVQLEVKVLQDQEDQQVQQVQQVLQVQEGQQDLQDPQDQVVEPVRQVLQDLQVIQVLQEEQGLKVLKGQQDHHQIEDLKIILRKSRIRYQLQNKLKEFLLHGMKNMIK